MSLPVGEALNWTPAQPPEPTELRGSHALVRPVRPSDAGPFYPLAHAPDGAPSIWTYLPYGPFERPEDLARFLESASASDDPLWFTLARLPDETPLGMAAYQRIEPRHGVIEIGQLWYGPPLKRTTAATELIYLLARHAFDDLGYRRLEWKCDALNAASRRAAERYGFRFEGVFRQHGRQGPQPRHGLVRDHRRRLAWHPRRLRGVAGARELRSARPPAAATAPSAMIPALNESRVWFITGASSGFGREIAAAALGRGDRVVEVGRATAIS